MPVSRPASPSAARTWMRSGSSASSSGALIGSMLNAPPSISTSGGPSGSPWRTAVAEGDTGTQAAPGSLVIAKAGDDGSSTKSPHSRRTGSAPSSASQQCPARTMAKPGWP